MKPPALAVVVCVCVAACGARHDVYLWSRPPLPPEVQTHSYEEPMAGLLEAAQAGDCERIVDVSEAFIDELRAESSLVFHGAEQEGSSAAMRSFLLRYVQSPSPALEIGAHGFRLPRWMTDDYAYCLVQRGELEKAATIYTTALLDGFDADLTWRLGLVSYWAGNPEIALSILQAWPTDVDVPHGYGAVLDLMMSGADVPNSIQVRSGSIN